LSFTENEEEFGLKCKAAGFKSIFTIASNTPEYGRDLPIGLCCKAENRKELFGKRDKDISWVPFWGIKLMS